MQPIHVLELGRVEYATGLELQHSLVELRKQGRIGDVLLLLEHSPVITLGRNARASNILFSEKQLAERGVQLFECDRGGDVTFHGPGQLVGYPIFDLRGFESADGRRKTLGAVEFVRRMEEALIRACGDLGLPTERRAGLTGVWTCGEPRKVAALGVHISRGVTSHGFALNVNNDLELFKLIVPCGISDKPVTSLQQELGDKKKLTMEEVRHAVARNFGRVFERQTLWLESLDALMQPQDVPAKAPRELREIQGEDETFFA